MSKCTNETLKRVGMIEFNEFLFLQFFLQCPVHGEHYIMFNAAHKTMLCMTCFRDTPPETRIHCVDIDTAYLQCGKKLDRALVVSAAILSTSFVLQRNSRSPSVPIKKNLKR